MITIKNIDNYKSYAIKRDIYDYNTKLGMIIIYSTIDYEIDFKYQPILKTIKITAEYLDYNDKIIHSAHYYSEKSEDIINNIINECIKTYNIKDIDHLTNKIKGIINEDLLYWSKSAAKIDINKERYNNFKKDFEKLKDYYNIDIDLDNYAPDGQHIINIIDRENHHLINSI